MSHQVNETSYHSENVVEDNSLTISSPNLEENETKIVTPSTSNPNKIKINGELPNELMKLTEKIPSLLNRLNSFLEIPETTLGKEPALAKERGLFFDLRDLIKEILTTTHKKLENQKFESSPFKIHPRTFLMGLLKKLPLLFLFLVASIFLAIFSGSKFEEKSYQTETVLLYKRSNKIQKEIPSLRTYLQIVELRENLVKVLKRTKLDCSIEKLKKAIEIKLGKRADLMIISVEWENPKEAGMIANVMREVFIEQQLDISREKIQTHIDGIEKHIQEKQDSFKKAKEEIETAMAKDLVLDLDKEIEINFNTISSLKNRYETVLVDQKAAGLQLESMGTIFGELQKLISKEKLNETQLNEIKEVNLRIARLRQQIDEDKKLRADSASLEQKKLAFERAKRLKAQGLISETQYQEAKTAYDKQKALTEETTQTEKWKTELEELLKIGTPSQGTVPSSEILRTMRQKAYDLEVEIVGNKGKIEQINNSVEAIQKRLRTLVKLRKKNLELKNQLTSWGAEESSLEAQLSEFQLELKSITSGFSLISEASIPTNPIVGKFKAFLMLGIIIIGIFLGTTLIVGLELFNSTIKSKGDLEVKINLPVLGILPKVRSFYTEEEAFLEPIRAVARRMHYVMNPRCGKFLVVGSSPEIGVSTISQHLATCFARQGNSVLLIDGNIRNLESNKSFDELLLQEKDTSNRKGLADFLLENCETLNEIVSPTRIPNVYCIPQSTVTEPDLLGSRSMEHLLHLASEKHQVTLIDSPPAIPYIDAELIAQHVDGIIFVIQSHKCKLSKIYKSLSQLRESRTPIIGVVLNQVNSWYQED